MSTQLCSILGEQYNNGHGESDNIITAGNFLKKSPCRCKTPTWSPKFHPRPHACAPSSGLPGDLGNPIDVDAEYEDELFPLALQPVIRRPAFTWEHFIPLVNYKELAGTTNRAARPLSPEWSGETVKGREAHEVRILEGAAVKLDKTDCRFEEPENMVFYRVDRKLRSASSADATSVAVKTKAVHNHTNRPPGKIEVTGNDAKFQGYELLYGCPECRKFTLGEELYLMAEILRLVVITLQAKMNHLHTYSYDEFITWTVQPFNRPDVQFNINRHFNFDAYLYMIDTCGQSYTHSPNILKHKPKGEHGVYDFSILWNVTRCHEIRAGNDAFVKALEFVIPGSFQTIETLNVVVEICCLYDYLPDTVVHAFSLMDRYLVSSRLRAGKENNEDESLMACVSVLVAAKYHEQRRPHFSTLLEYYSQGVARECVVEAEWRFLERVQWATGPQNHFPSLSA